MKKISFITIIFVCFVALSFAQSNVYRLPLDSGQTVKGSTLCYMLPTTSLKVTVNVTKVREYKGYYADHAESLLGLKNIITENRTYYKLQSVDIEPVTVPDANETYLVKLSSRQIKNGFQTRASQGAFIQNLKQRTNGYTTSSKPIPDFFKNYSDPTFTEMEDSFVETKIIDGVVTQVPANRTKLVSKSNIQKAQEAADAIGKCRKDQYSLVAGEQETPYSEDAIQTMWKGLKIWEENYLSLFTGLTLEDKISYTFYVNQTTDGNSYDNLPIFTFDADKGLTINEDHTFAEDSNNSYTLVFEPVYKTATVDNVLQDIKSGQKEPKKHGYFYRKPMPVKVSLTTPNNSANDLGIINMYQFGRIQFLSPNQDNLNISDFGFIY